MTGNRAPVLGVFAVLSILGAGIYGHGIHGPFLYDDVSCIVENTTIQSIGGALKTFGDPNALSSGGFNYFNYRPLLPVVYAFVYALFGLAPPAYHVLNIVLHIFTGLALFLLIRRVTGGGNMVAFLATVLWFIHPTHVESVESISGTDDILCGLFLISTILLVLRRRWILALIVYALALTSKELAVVGPAMVFAAVYVDRDEALPARLKAALLAAIPFGVFAAAFWIARTSVMTPRHSGSPVQGLTDVFFVAPKVFLTYLRLLLFPVDLRINYFFEIVHRIDTAFVVGWLAISAVAVAFVVALRRAQIVAFGLAWFAVTYLPVSNVLPIRALAAERFMYLPFAGLAIVAAVGIAKLERHKTRLVALSVAIVALWSALSFARVHVWNDEELFWKDIIAKEPGFAGYQMYENNLALYYLNAKRFDEALALFSKLYQQDSDNTRTAHNYAQLLLMQKQYAEAAPIYQGLIKALPNNAVVAQQYTFVMGQVTEPAAPDPGK
ncbi:MAG: tetratricopeptide repeat protein [Deltaproteobacteria bacterium]|nr:tetratricopeptide repeat protein [Deltaproteobacteria bacterium]